MRADVQPVAGATLANLDIARLADYFSRARQQDCPDLADSAAWTQLLLNTELMVELRDAITPVPVPVPSVAGLLLFGDNPNRFLPQAGIMATAYPGVEKDYSATQDRIRGPLVSLFQRDAAGQPKLLLPGVIDRAVAFVRQHAADPDKIVGAIRTEQPHYPPDAVREALVNAVAHRDYLLSGTDVEVALYADRLEIISPGRLPNGMTVARMRAGTRATRNQLVLDVLRDYQYMENRGLGIPRKIIPLMRAHNGTEPELIVDGDRFTVRLWRG